MNAFATAPLSTYVPQSLKGLGAPTFFETTRPHFCHPVDRLQGLAFSSLASHAITDLLLLLHILD